MNDQTAPAQKKENPLLEILINIVIPSVILITLSKENYLGPQWGIIVALSFPIINGLKDLATSKKLNFFSVLGVITVALTGGMSLLELDPKYIAIKEAAVPGLLCILTLVSLKTRYPLVKTFLYNEKVMQIDKITEALKTNNNEVKFERCLANASLLVALSFFVSSILNYALAKILLVSPPGTEAYNAELGKMLALSFPVNALPALLVLLYAFYYLYRSITKLTHLKLEEIIAEH